MNECTCTKDPECIEDLCLSCLAEYQNWVATIEAQLLPLKSDYEEDN